MPVRDFCQLWLCQFPYVPVRAPYGTLAGHARAPYESRRIWKQWRFPCGARAGIAQGTRGVLRIIQQNHKYAAVSSRTGPVAWCDHGNSTNVKFLRALHSTLRARNPTGDKNRTWPVVGCHWDITKPVVPGDATMPLSITAKPVGLWADHSSYISICEILRVSVHCNVTVGRFSARCSV